MNFSDRFAASVRAKDSRLVVGLDPHLHLLPSDLIAGTGKSDRAALGEAMTRFGLEIVDAVHDVAAALKPQVAFFERIGPAGYRALETVVAAARARDLLVIADAKRGDIGSTAQANADYYFGDATGDSGGAVPGLGADAATVNPYMGEDTLAPYEPYLDAGHGLFLIAKTSNPGSGDLQDRIVESDAGPVPVYRAVADMAARIGARHGVGEAGYGPAGIVVGATYPEQGEELRAAFPSLIILVPGLGAQGAQPADIAGYFDADGLGAAANASRSVIFAYRDNESVSWQAAARNTALKLRDEINEAIVGRG